MPLEPGTRLGPYDILSPLGQGGMGEVYMAQDSRLDRVVAIKVLPGDLAADPTARARFDREARAIAGLNHPNVCALFDVGQDRGHDFIVMELLEGETLQQRLDGGPLDVGVLVDYAIALADALDAAHARGLIHRDLKPANIFITTRDVPKILDFGLAKAVEAADETTRLHDSLTGLGTTLGTVAYMSPEQLRGDPLDARTDLFSLGLVFYEMATGKRVYTGATTAVVSAGILGPDVPSPRRFRPDLPPRLEDTILKALEKDRNLRCQSAAELRADLMRLKREASESSRAAVAVAEPPAKAPDARTVAPAPAPAPVQAAGPVPVTAPPANHHTGTWVAIVAVIVGTYLFRGYVRSLFVSPATTTQTSVAPPPGPTSVAPPPAPAPSPAPSQAPAAVSTPGSASASAATPPASRGAVLPPPVTSTQAAPPTSPASPTLAPATPAAADAVTPGKPGGRGRAGAAQGAGPGRAGRGGRNMLPQSGGLILQLKTLPPQNYHIVFLAGNVEARDLAFELQGVLNAGGWTSSGVAPTADAAVPLGIGVPRNIQAANAFFNWATRNGFTPDLRVMPALQEIQITVGAQRAK